LVPLASEHDSSRGHEPQLIRVKGKAVRLRKALLGFVVVNALALPLLLLQWGDGPLEGSEKALLIIGLLGTLAAAILVFYRLALLLGDAEGNEHDTHPEQPRGFWPRWGTTVMATAAVLLLSGAICTIDLDSTGTPLTLVTLAAAVTVITGGSGAARLAFSSQRQGPTEPQYRSKEDAERPAYSIACSGGGIRSAAFCLGALQRLRKRDKDGTPSLYEQTDTVYGVSGGGYIATALHAARTYSAQDDDKVFDLGSPEEDRLRRTSRYLAATVKERTLGLLSLLFGLIINLVLVGASLGLFAWWMAAWLRRSEAMAAYETWFPDKPRSELADDEKPEVNASLRWEDLFVWSGDDEGEALDLRSWEPEAWLWLPLSLAVIAAVGFLVLKLSQRVLHGRADPEPGREAHAPFALSSAGDRWIRALQRWIPPTFWAGVVAAALLVGTPVAISTISSATVKNQPTVAAAGVSAQLGFASPAACAQAAQRSFRSARQRALGTGGTTFSYGACGKDAQNVPVSLDWPTCKDPDSTKRDQNAGASTGETPGAGAAADEAPGADPAATTESAADCAETVQAFVDGRVGAAPLSSFWGSLVALVTALTAIVGSIMKGPRPTDTTRLARLRAWARTRLVPWLGAGLVVVTAVITYLRLTYGLTVAKPMGEPPIFERTAWLWGAAAALAGVRVLTDATSSSMHPFYRRRLAETFLLRRTDDGHTEPVPYSEPQLLSEVRPSGMQGPGLVLCAAANISDPEYIPTQRECSPFRFATSGPTAAPRIGLSDSWRLPGGMRDAVAFEGAADPYRREATLAAAMAISGAAVAPRTGRANHRSRPYRLLLALANARLGVWLPNPYWVAEGTESSAGRATDPITRVTDKILGREPDTGGKAPVRRFLRRTVIFVQSYFQKPGPFRLAAEAFGSATVYSQRLYVTDGGHYDNTALVEALRDHPECLIVIDASNDPEDSFYALADAITTARMDLGVDVNLDLRPLRADESGRSSRPWTTGTAVPTGTRNEGPTTRILVVKASLFRDLPFDLEMYKRRHPEFPRTSTGDQLYGEYDFEAYRRLGYEAMSMALAAEPVDDSGG
jgi:hypothetical protein